MTDFDRDEWNAYAELFNAIAAAPRSPLQQNASFSSKKFLADHLWALGYRKTGS